MMLPARLLIPAAAAAAGAAVAPRSERWLWAALFGAMAGSVVLVQPAP